MGVLHSKESIKYSMIWLLCKLLCQPAWLISLNSQHKTEKIYISVTMKKVKTYTPCLVLVARTLYGVNLRSRFSFRSSYNTQ